MNCPNCKIDLHCGCNACRKRAPDEHVGKRMIMDGDIETCPGCNLTMHCDAWLDVEADYRKGLREENMKTAEPEAWDTQEYKDWIKERGELQVHGFFQLPAEGNYVAHADYVKAEIEVVRLRSELADENQKYRDAVQKAFEYKTQLENANARIAQLKEIT